MQAKQTRALSFGRDICAIGLSPNLPKQIFVEDAPAHVDKAALLLPVFFLCGLVAPLLSFEAQPLKLRLLRGNLLRGHLCGSLLLPIQFPGYGFRRSITLGLLTLE